MTSMEEKEGAKREAITVKKYVKKIIFITLLRFKPNVRC
jgi:hypothetical protein